MENKIIYDVIVVGGGLSGLKSAYDLKKSNFNVLVLEARNRFGGRTESIKIDNGWVDIGGQWVGTNHHSIKELIIELNLKTYKQYYKGKTIIDLKNINNMSIKSIDDENIKFNDFGNGKLKLIFKKINFLLTKIDFDNLSNSNIENLKLVKSIEKLSLQEWLEFNGYGEFDYFFNWVSKMVLASNYKDISFLFFLKYIKSCGGGIEGTFLSNNEDCSEESRVIGGSQIISDRMLKYIKNCKLNTEVISIDQRGCLIGENNNYNYNKRSIITIKTRNNDTYYCKDVIVTIPIPLLKNVTFLPELPNNKRKLVKTMRMGCTLKVIIVYKNAFWREKGYNGKVLNFGGNGPISESFDNSTHDNSVNSIVGFIVGKDSVQYWLSKSFEFRKNAILNQYSNYWGNGALYPKYYIEKNWEEEKYTQGCYSGLVPPGNDILSTSSDYYQKPFGNIHWAGSESSNQHYGHMEGAILSSKRVVNEIILKSLKNSKY